MGFGVGAAVNAYPLPVEVFGGDGRGGTAAERIQHPIARVAGGPDDALVQGQRFLVGRAGALLARGNFDVQYDVPRRNAFAFIQVHLAAWYFALFRPVDQPFLFHLVQTPA